MRIDHLVPGTVYDFGAVLAREGYQAWIVGGAIRNLALGREPSDWDAATDARPEDVMRAFRRTVPTGVKHGTVTVLWRGLQIETTTFRVEEGYADGRRPDRVSFTPDIREDLKRRDFTMNAMALNLSTRDFLDPHDGLGDLERRLVRAIGDPLERFSEDGLRPLRAVRFASQLGYAIDVPTFEAIGRSLHRFRAVSAERVRDEFAKILLSPKPSYGIGLLERSGLLAEFLPELADCRGVEQGGLHSFDVFDHLAAACDAAPPVLELRLAALLHDLGKPGRKAGDAAGGYSFHRHEEDSARMVKAILPRLKFPNLVTERVERLARHHMFSYGEEWTDAAVRRFVARVGEDLVEDLLALRVADSAALAGTPPDPRGVAPFRKRIEAVLAASRVLGVKDLAVSGNELAAIGVPRGPVMGRMLAELLEAVMEDPSLNERDRLLLIAERMKEKYGLS
ncbi:MAG: HD domain-containing protein [Spirochaetia bacterium]|nr:HD domain-containing protein [Spirochaetia bacterium]